MKPYLETAPTRQAQPPILLIVMTIVAVFFHVGFFSYAILYFSSEFSGLEDDKNKYVFTFC